jgi:pimeloyl-ACP methyl ester carboxylesterase
VIHGFGASPAWFNTRFFSLKRFFADGWDVLLYTLPFHGGRAAQHVPLNGLEMFAGGFSRLHEAVIHAVHDFRALVDYVLGTGAPRVGVTGLSLGGYITSLLAAVAGDPQRAGDLDAVADRELVPGEPRDRGRAPRDANP